MAGQPKVDIGSIESRCRLPGATGSNPARGYAPFTGARGGSAHLPSLHRAEAEAKESIAPEGWPAILVVQHAAMGFGVGLSAQRAAEPAKAVSVPPEPLARRVAGFADHAVNGLCLLYHWFN